MNNENLRPTKGAKSKFAGINTILPAVVDELGLDRRMQEKALFSLWPSLLDSVYVSRSMPLYIDGQGILVVAVENGSTAQELSFLKTKLLAQLQPIGTGLGLTIKGIRFDMKRFSQIQNTEEHGKALNNEAADRSAPADSELAAFTLSEAEVEEIAELKQKLQAMLEQLPIESGTDESSSRMPERIAHLVEKKLRLKKWCAQQNIPVCEQCGELLSQSSHQLNRMLCYYCTRTAPDM